MNSCISITKSAIFSIATQLERKKINGLWATAKKFVFCFDGGIMTTTTTMTTMTATTTTTTTPTTMTTTKMTCLEADKDCLQAFKCFLSRKESWKSTQCWKKMLKSLSQYWTFGHGILRQGWSKSSPSPMKSRNCREFSTTNPVLSFWT